MNEILRIVFLFYFITHIPISIVLDYQALLSEWYPQNLRDFYNWYATSFNDVLMSARPVWLQSFIFAELFFQGPFFFVAIYALLRKRAWIRIPGIIYGVHVATTVLPILAEIAFSKKNSLKEKRVLFCCYSPYFIIPALFASYLASHPIPFPPKVMFKAKQ
jgi:hypothetical protein